MSMTETELDYRPARQTVIMKMMQSHSSFRVQRLNLSSDPRCVSITSMLKGQRGKWGRSRQTILNFWTLSFWNLGGSSESLWLKEPSKSILFHNSTEWLTHRHELLHLLFLPHFTPNLSYISSFNVFVFLVLSLTFLFSPVLLSQRQFPNLADNKDSFYSILDLPLNASLAHPSLG